MSKFSVKKPLTVLVAVIVVLVLGFVSFTRMTPDLLPNIDLPYVIVTTTYVGASPEEVESEVTKPLEASLATLDDIETVSSTSAENYSMIMLQFTEDANLDSVTVDILQKINTLQGGWDDMVGTPNIMKINPNMLPVMIAAVGYEGMDIIELSDFVNDSILPKLEGTTGVASVSASGVLREEINVIINHGKLAELNTRIAEKVNEQIDETEAELQDTLNEMESNLASVKSGQGALDSGKDALVGQAAGAGAQLTQQQAALEAQKAQLQAQLLEVQTQLAGAQQMRIQLLEAIAGLQEFALMEEATLTGLGYAAQMAGYTWFEGPYDSYYAIVNSTNEYDRAFIDGILQSQGSSLAELTAGFQMMDAAMTEATETPITGPVSGTVAVLQAYVGEIDAGIAQANAGVDTLNGYLNQMAAGTSMINDYMTELEKKKLEGLLTISEGSTQIIVGETTLSQVITQLEGGLDQIADAREAALKSSNLENIITMSMVSQILSAQNFAMPAGSVTSGGDSILVTVGDTIASLEELQDLLLFDMGMDGIEPIRLSDVADVYMTDNSGEIYANINGNSGILFTFNKQSNYSTAGVSDNLLDTFAALEGQYPGLSFTSLMNQGDYIYMVIRAVIENLLMGAVLAVIILFLFLRDLRPTLITLVSIPVSVVFAFVLMYFSGVTLNMLSLAGLAVAVGMLVDNSVVVIENIYRLRAKGYSAIQAAVSGAGQVAGAIASSTLTTICIFVPIVFVEGITRQLFTDFALTFAFALIASLVIALTVVPAMSSRMLGNIKSKDQKVMNRVMQAYESALKWVLRHKLPVLAATLALLILSGVLVLSRGFTFMPAMDMGQLTVSVEMPEDTDFEVATGLADEVVEAIATVDGVDTVGAMMGGSGLSILGMGGGSGGNDVTMYVITDENTRRSSDDIAAEIEEKTAGLACEVSVSSSSNMDISMLSGNGVSIVLYSDDLDDLRETAQELADVLERVEGVTEVTGLDKTGPALRVVVDKDKAMAEGLTVAQVYMELAGALSTETTATTLTYDGDSYSVIVDKGVDDELTPAYIRGYSFTTTNARTGEESTIRLTDIAEVVETETLSSISRSESRRRLSITANIADDNNVTLVARDIESALSGYTLRAGVTYELSGESETIMESMRELLNMLLLGIVLVYLIMVAQFQSLKSPFIVMFTIPLAFTGGLLALFFTGFEMSVISMIGFVMLVGLIVNNGIVLVDYINQLRAEGAPTREAIVEAGITRMRPILMTTLTTVFGLVTMAFGMGAGGEMMQPIAIVAIGGLLYATVLTLFVVPAMYEMMNRKELKVVSDEELEIVED